MEPNILERNANKRHDRLIAYRYRPIFELLTAIDTELDGLDDINPKRNISKKYSTILPRKANVCYNKIRISIMINIILFIIRKKSIQLEMTSLSLE